MAKAQAEYSNFDALDLVVGRVVSVEDSKTTKPTYKIRVDFGAEIGIKTTCGAYRNYKKDDLVGKLVVGLVNTGTKKMGPEISEFLLLGVRNEEGQTIYLTTESEVPLGAQVF